MWKATENKIPAREVLRDHLDTLQKAADTAFECETISIREVQKAFDYFYVMADNKCGLSLFKKGLAQKNPQLMLEGILSLKKQFGEA